jgi:adenosylhomocysteinase
MGHFDVEIDMAWLNSHWKKESVKPGVDLYKNGANSLLVLGEGRLLNLACANGHPPLVMSNSFSCQLLAQLALFKSPHAPGIYPFPAALDQEVARLHLQPLGAELTPLSDSQKAYLSI